MREHGIADDAFVHRNRAARSNRHQARDFRKVAAVDAGFDIVEVVHRGDGLLQRGITGTLAQAVDRGVDVAGTRQHSGQRVRSGHPQVVVGVHFKFEISRLAQLPDAVVGDERIQQPERVGETEALRTRSLCRIDHAQQKIRIRARGVLTADTDVQAHILGVFDEMADSIQHPFPITPQLVADLNIGNRNRQIDDVYATAGGGHEVGFAHAAPDHQARRQPQAGNGKNVLAFFRPHDRDTYFHFRHTGGGQGARDDDAFFGAEGHASGLLAIAQGRVVDDYRRLGHVRSEENLLSSSKEQGACQMKWLHIISKLAVLAGDGRGGKTTFVGDCRDYDTMA
jgi:hypothetical protein